MPDLPLRREIPGAPGYTVTPDGQIYGPKGTPLARAVTREGHPVASVKFEGKRTHMGVAHLICLAFHGPRPSPRHYAVYLNGDRTDSRPENVAWKTPEEFHIFGPPRKPPTGLASLSADDVEAIRASTERAVDLAARYGVRPKVIWNIRRGSNV